MKAVILAGGFGTRLRPITYSCPKPMLPVGGRPFLEYLMNFLKTYGITDVILCLHYLAERVSEYFGDGTNFGLRIKYSVEKEPLGTAGAIKNVEDFLDESFLVLNGDTYMDLNLQEMLSFHRNKKALGTIALVKVKDPLRYGVVNVSEDRRITSFSEKAYANEGYVNAGVYIFEKRILDYIPNHVKVSLEREILSKLLNDERLYGFLSEGYFIDIGVPDDYVRFQKEALDGVLI